MTELLPVWKDIPVDLPTWVTPRVGRDGQEVIVQLTAQVGDTILHVDSTVSNFASQYKTLVNCLGSLVFETEHPGEFIKLSRRQANAAVQVKDISDEDRALWARYKELTYPGTLQISTPERRISDG